jgi:hypothetical protein
MVVKLVALVLVTAAIPGALWLGDALPLPERPDRPDAAAGGQVNEVEFTSRVEAICKWEVRRTRGLRRILHRQYTPDHLEALVQSVAVIGEESAAVFGRLDVPSRLEKPAKRLLRLLRAENRLVERIRAAVQKRNYGEVVREARKLSRLAPGVTPLLRELGVRDCDPNSRAGISEGDIVEA